MRIEDFSNPTASKSLRYDRRSIATVVKVSDDTGADNVLGVYIPRLMFGLPISTGPYDKSINVDTSKIKNKKNKTIGKTSIKIRNYCILPIAVIPNSDTPHFVLGENVFVDMADSDLKTMFILPYSLGEVNRRQYDQYTIRCPSLSKPGDEMTPDNTYGFQINTEDQIISLWTSQNNKEKSTYAIFINAKDGKMTISDGGKRVIDVDTENDSILIQNEKESKVELVGDIVNIKCGTLNIEAADDINIKAKNMKREVDNVKSTITEDQEEVDKLNIKGNEFKGEYNKQEWSGSEYKNKTNKWVVDSPISGFTKVLTADSFSISPNAGMNPLPTCANWSNAGIGSFGNPAVASLPLVKFMPLNIALNMITATVDSIGSIYGIPPSLTASLSGMTSQIMTNNVKG